MKQPTEDDDNAGLKRLVRAEMLSRAAGYVLVYLDDEQDDGVLRVVYRRVLAL